MREKEKVAASSEIHSLYEGMVTVANVSVKDQNLVAMVLNNERVGFGYNVSSVIQDDVKIDYEVDNRDAIGVEKMDFRVSKVVRTMLMETIVGSIEGKLHDGEVLIA